MSGVRPAMAHRWEILRPDEVQRLHDATLQLLSEVGVVFHSEQALAVLRAHGAKVEGETVHFPPQLVEKALETVPGEIVLHGRTPARDLVLGQGNIHYTSCFGPVRVRRIGEKETVAGTLEDLRNFTVLSDAIDNVSYCLFHVRPHEVPAGLHDVYCAATMLKITDKHVHFSQDTARNTETLISLGEIAAADAGVAGPVFSLGCCPNSPLFYTEDACNKLLIAVPKGITFLVVSGAMAGGTSPVTLAGTLLVQNAEVLAGFTLAQLLRPGAPLIYGSFSGGMDFSSGIFVSGGAELALLQAATAQICRFYRVPYGYGTGGWTDAREPGPQAGFEKACTMLSAALAGVEVIHSAIGGMLGGLDIADYAQMIIDDELAGMVNRYVRGIEVSEETLAYDVIREVGPTGQFLDSTHTARFFRKEHFLPRILERVIGEVEIDSILIRAQERARHILNTHKPNHLSQAASEQIDEIVAQVTGQYA